MSDIVVSADELNPANDFLEPEDVSNEGICRLMSNAYMEAEIKENSVYVTDGRSCWITPEAENKRISFAMYYVFKGATSDADKLAYANKINDELPIIRASISSKSGNLALDWYLPYEGGLTRRSVVYAVKRFLRLIDSAIDLDTGDLLQ